MLSSPDATGPVSDEDRAVDTDDTATDQVAGEPADDDDEVLIDAVLAEDEDDPEPAGDNQP